MSIPMLPCIRLLILQYMLNSGIQIQVVREATKLRFQLTMYSYG